VDAWVPACAGMTLSRLVSVPFVTDLLGTFSGDNSGIRASLPLCRAQRCSSIRVADLRGPCAFQGRRTRKIRFARPAQSTGPAAAPLRHIPAIASTTSRAFPCLPSPVPTLIRQGLGHGRLHSRRCIDNYAAHPRPPREGIKDMLSSDQVLPLDLNYRLVRVEKSEPPAGIQGEVGTAIP
jgi:hypothetical protein